MKNFFYILDIIICTFSYSGLYYVKTGSFIPQGEYLTLFGVYILFWFLLSVYNKRYRHLLNSTFRDYYRSQFFSAAFTLFILTIIISLTDLKVISRLFLVGIIAVPSLLELLIFGLRSRWLSINRKLEKGRSEASVDTTKATFRLKWLVVGFVLFIIVFLLMVRLKSGSFGYYPWWEHVLLLLLSTWIISIGLTGKYKYFPSQNIYYHIAPFIKSGFIMFILAGMVYYFFRLESLSRMVLFGTIPLYAIIETGVFAFIFIGERESASNSITGVSNNGYSNIFGQDPLPIGSEFAIKTSEHAIDIQSLFSRISIKESDGIIQFLLNNIDSEYEKSLVALLSTTSLENISVLQNHSKNLLINLHNLNDIRRLNEYMITCHDKIKPGGMLFGNFIPLEKVRNKLKSKMPRIVFLIFSPIHFFIYRIFPKLPKIRHLYFVLTNGRNRAISKAEVFGRLSFCGYKVFAEKLIGSTLYFIARQLKTVSTEDNPSYGLIVNLKRVGMDGKIISVYKFRTMHPYSEFIQKELFENHSLNLYGKFKDDFRITAWGRVLRKLWIDELPQLYNWVRGDMTLVGVRALSEHYFSLYPKDLQDLRTQLKPGLLPPYYADMPKSFDEILESERCYLERKKAKPFSTDFIYFWKAFINIVFHGARSQ